MSPIENSRSHEGRSPCAVRFLCERPIRSRQLGHKVVQKRVVVRHIFPAEGEQNNSEVTLSQPIPEFTLRGGKIHLICGLIKGKLS